MGRGLVWLLGALGLSGLLILGLAGVCGSPAKFPAVSGFFCGRPRPAAAPAPRATAPAPRATGGESAPGGQSGQSAPGGGSVTGGR